MPKLSEPARHELADQVLREIGKIDPELKRLAYRNLPHKIDFSQFGKGESPIINACRALQEEDAFKPRGKRQFQWRNEVSLRKSARHWFVEKYSQWNQHHVVDLGDAPRHAQPGVQLVDADWNLLRDALTQWKWKDTAGNMRRFSSLEAAMHEKELRALDEDSNARTHLNALLDIYKRSGVHAWRSLDELARARWKLHGAREVFKEDRDRARAQEGARRMLGYMPIIEYHRSKRPRQRNVHHCKKVKLLTPAGQVRDWYFHDQSWQHLWACVDPFHQDLASDPGQDANTVCLEEGEVMEVLTAQKPNRLKCEKQMYMVVTMAGYGVLSVAAMYTGSRLKTIRSTPLRTRFRYWFQQLQEHQIGSSQQEEELARSAEGWKV